MTRDQSPWQHQNDSRERLEAARVEQQQDNVNKNRPISQEFFSSPQITSQLQSQSAAPFTQLPPAKSNPFQKSAEVCSAFLREREKRRER